MAEHLTKVGIWGGPLPYYVAERRECGMTPLTCKLFDHGDCLRKISSDKKVLQEVVNANRELLANQIDKGVQNEKLSPVVCGVQSEKA